MSKPATDFKTYLNQEIDRTKGIAVPVRETLLRRLVIKHLSVTRLHPNPDDEFCLPGIGPNESIISRYASEFHQYGKDEQAAAISHVAAYQPLIVHKIKPDGYMIMNGHHRWAGALKAGKQRLPVAIVNLTQPGDLEKHIKNTRNHMRVTLDLDEVVLSGEGEDAEKGLAFPFSRLYPQRLRLGIPALFYMLNQQKYDIWVYTSGLYSFDHIMRLLGHHHAQVACVITGAGRKTASGKDLRARAESLAERKYTVTCHIDQKTVLRVFSADKSFEEYPLPGTDIWSREVMDVFRRMQRA